MLNFDSEDIDDMNEDAGDEQEPAPTGRRTTTSSHNIYMVDTPKEGNGDEIAEDDPSKKQPQRRRQRCRSKSRHSKNSDNIARGNNSPVDSRRNNDCTTQVAEHDQDANYKHSTET